ncbi:GDP-mannose 4,6-dehydratase [Candidatus Woesearchaeota archaeon]|nr:GDP-mannose 4,6-dehydratase [Candidatus Woesearchaeota archaeon]
MKRVLITGITGFIGNEVARKICDEYEVYGLVRTTSNKNALNPVKDILGKIEIRYGNLTDFSAIRKIVKDISPHYIIHLGAATAVRHSFENPLEFQETTHLATVNLVHAALDLAEFKKFIFASTMETYGDQNQKTPFKEDLILNPLSPYAVAKVASDYYIRMAGKAFGLPYFILRCCNTYGRKDNAGFVVEYITTQMLKNEPVYIGSPDAVRDLMFVDDHVNAYVTALKSDIKNEVFNFSPGNAISMKELAEKLKEITGYKMEIIFSFPPGYPSRPVVDPYLSLDATKAKAILKWEPRFSLEEGLKKIVEYWRKNI